MNLNTGLINQTEISVPPTLPEQSAIATILSDMDAEIAALEAKHSQGPPTQAGHDAGTTHREDSPHMKISTVLDHIDSGHMALPEFQRYVQTEVLFEETAA